MINGEREWSMSNDEIIYFFSCFNRFFENERGQEQVHVCALRHQHGPEGGLAGGLDSLG